MDYVLATLMTEGQVPQGAKLHRSEGQYFFYPFSNKGAVWTIDSEIWELFSENSNSITYWLAVGIDELIPEALEEGNKILLAAVIENNSFHALGRKNRTHLPSLEDWGSRMKITHVKNLGYDVVDAVGLSALTNIGLSEFDMNNFPSRLAVNNFGLLRDVESARSYAKFSDNAASEHAPFLAARIVLGQWN